MLRSRCGLALVAVLLGVVSLAACGGDEALMAAPSTVATVLHTVPTTTTAPPAPSTTVRAPRVRAQAVTAPETPSGRCGGDLPPCSVMMCESGGDIRAQNRTSTASGKWQFIDSTWGGYGGYDRAWQAPEDVQDAKAREYWNGGAGASHWASCL